MVLKRPDLYAKPLLVHPFAKGDLTSNGIQYSTPVETTTPDTDVEIESVTVEFPIQAQIIEVEFGLTAAFKAVSSITADLKYKWQARNKGGDTWVDLVAEQTLTDIGTTLTEYTVSGNFPLVDDFRFLPADIRLILQCNELNEGHAKTKNSSWIRFWYL